MLLRLLLSCLTLLASLTASHAEDGMPVCDIQNASVSQSVEPKLKDSIYFDNIALHFTPRDRDEIAPGYIVAEPQLTISVNWNSFISTLAAELASDFRIKADENDIDYVSSGFRSVSTANGILRIHGFAKFEKWAKWTWTCCKWFKCRKCEAKTRIFSKTLDFIIDINKHDILKTDLGANYPFGSDRIEKQKASGIQVYEDISFSSFGQTVGSPDLLEQIFDVVSNTVSLVTEIWGDEQFSFSDIYNLQQQNPEEPLGSKELLQTTQYDYGYSDSLRAGTGEEGYRHRGFWQAFFSSLTLNPKESGFVIGTNGPRLVVAYSFNLDHYYSLLAEGGVSDSLDTDVLFYSVFCSVGKSVFEQYLRFVADKYAGKDEDVTIENSEVIKRDKLVELLDKGYGFSGVIEYFKDITGILLQPGEYSLPSIDRIAQSPGVFRIAGSLWSLHKEYDMSTRERACAERLAIRRSGSRDLVFPMQDVSTCFESEVSEEQKGAIEEAISRFGPEVFRLGSIKVGLAPVAGTAKYRGWYYCYTTTTVCSGSKVIIWFDDLSKFDARAGRHKGVDLIDTADGESSQAIAVGTGRLIYSNSDPSGWGHALLLPFSKDGKEYFAVYAHLPADARKLDGKDVRAGDKISPTGCSGNAGDGKGKCNAYCYVNGAFRTDGHLHFEVIERNAGTLKKVDPLDLLGFQVQEDADKTIYKCQEAPALVAAAE
jgi:hypothetical protein